MAIFTEEERRQYGGKYVTLFSFNNHTITASVDTPQEARLEARLEAKRLGYKHPVMVYVPKIDEIVNRQFPGLIDMVE